MSEKTSKYKQTLATGCSGSRSASCGEGCWTKPVYRATQAFPRLYHPDFERHHRSIAIRDAWYVFLHGGSGVVASRLAASAFAKTAVLASRAHLATWGVYAGL